MPMKCDRMCHQAKRLSATMHIESRFMDRKLLAALLCFAYVKQGNSKRKHFSRSFFSVFIACHFFHMSLFACALLPPGASHTYGKLLAFVFVRPQLSNNSITHTHTNTHGHTLRTVRKQSTIESLRNRSILLMLRE